MMDFTSMVFLLLTINKCSIFSVVMVSLQISTSLNGCHPDCTTTIPCNEKCMIHSGFSSLDSVFMWFSDMTNSPLGTEKLEISWPPCIKPVLSDWMKLSGGLADRDKLTMADCSTPHLTLLSENKPQCLLPTFCNSVNNHVCYVIFSLWFFIDFSTVIDTFHLMLQFDSAHHTSSDLKVTSIKGNDELLHKNCGVHKRRSIWRVNLKQANCSLFIHQNGHDIHFIL